MWWDPQNAGQRNLVEVLSKITERLQSPSQAISALYGVGSFGAWPFTGDRFLLLVVDQEFSPPPRGASFVQRFRRARLSRLRPWQQQFWQTAPQHRRHNILWRLDELPDRVRLLLKDWNLPDDTYIFFASPPVATVAVPASRILCQERIGTLGMLVERISKVTYPSEPILCKGVSYTTAGHLIKQAPSEIYTESLRWLRAARRTKVGTVYHSNDPTSAPGVDLALVEVSDGQTQHLIVQASKPLNVRDLSQVTLFGGASGQRPGWINGALTHVRSLDGRKWTNVWVINESWSGFAQKGDSGGIVQLDSGEVLGHLIAAFGTVRRNGLRQCGLVQDAETVLSYIKNNVLAPNEDIGAIRFTDPWTASAE